LPSYYDKVFVCIILIIKIQRYKNLVFFTNFFSSLLHRTQVISRANLEKIALGGRDFAKPILKNEKIQTKNQVVQRLRTLVAAHVS